VAQLNIMAKTLKYTIIVMIALSKWCPSQFLQKEMFNKDNMAITSPYDNRRLKNMLTKVMN